MTTATRKKTVAAPRQFDELLGTFAPVVESVDSIEEAKRPKGALAVISGDAAECDLWNTNDRFYSRKAMEGAIKEAMESGRLGQGRVVGEIEHPDDGGSLRRVAIKYTDLYIREGENGRSFLSYKGIVLDNDEGRHLMSLLEAGVGVGQSTRGRAKFVKKKAKATNGETKEGDYVERFILKAIDPVGSPSNPAGAIDHYESEDEMQITAKSLREDHADVVESIEADARKGYVKESDVKARIDAAVEAAVAESKKGLSTPEQVAEAVTKAKEGLFTQAQVDEAVTKAKEGLFTEAEVKAKADEAVKAEKDRVVAEATAAEKKTKALGEIVTECAKPERAIHGAILQRLLIKAVESGKEYNADLIKECEAEAVELAEAAGLKAKGKGKQKPSGAVNDATKGKDAEESDEGEKPKTSRTQQLAGIGDQ